MVFRVSALLTLATLAFSSSVLSSGSGCNPSVALSPATKATTGRPAFLDSPTEVRFGLLSPISQKEAEGQFAVTLNGKPLEIQKVTMGGEPEMERILPRTPGRVVLAGTIQSALGGKDWDPDGEVTQMTEDPKGIHTLVVRLPAGRYEYKAAIDGSWNENYGRDYVRAGGNIGITVPSPGGVVKFVVDRVKGQILDSINHPSLVSAPAEAPPQPKRSAETKFGTAILTLAKPIASDLIDDTLTVTYKGEARTVYAREILSSPQFMADEALGSIYTKSQTTFKVWSPPSSKVDLLMFDSAFGGQPRVTPMAKDKRGVWKVVVPGDLHGKFYQFRFESYGETRIATDINCHAVNSDSTRSMVVDLDRTDPPSWPSAPKVRHKSQTDAVIYELSVRDFTVNPNSGVPQKMRGKYAGLAYPGTKSPSGKIKTGLDYMADLGVTDIHLLPVQNFLVSGPEEYTWGYATNLFNVPENTYSMTPEDPVGVIREFKSMVSGVHKARMRVVLDVVYNHTWPPEGKDSAFWQTIPYYYFRTNDRGDVLNESGVGNALNDDRPMVRKYVRDSLLFWLDEYKVDGFRFDLIGMHSPDSVKDWAKAILAKRPDATLYGEPWTGGGPTRFGKGAQRGTRMAVFNDRFRNPFRGELDGDSPGFIMGGGGAEADLIRGIKGSIGPDGFTDSPEEAINYVSAHDNLTLRDRIAKSIPSSQPEVQRASLRLAGAVVLLSQGVPFLEGGAEIGRTKGGNGNSYNAGDQVNGYDWELGEKFVDVRDWYRGLVGLRRSVKAFRLDSAAEIEKNFRLLPNLGDKTLGWTLQGQPGDAFVQYKVVLNGGLAQQTLAVGKGWTLLADGRRASSKGLGAAPSSLKMEPLSAYVLARR